MIPKIPIPINSNPYKASGDLLLFNRYRELAILPKPKPKKYAANIAEVATALEPKRRINKFCQITSNIKEVRPLIKKNISITLGGINFIFERITGYP